MIGECLRMMRAAFALQTLQKNPEGKADQIDDFTHDCVEKKPEKPSQEQALGEFELSLINTITDMP